MTTQERATTQLNELPGDDGLPLIGYSIQFARGRMLGTHEWYERFGPV